MSTLEGKSISSTYPSVLHLEGNTVGLSGSLQFVQDGKGVASVLKLSTTEVSTSNITITGGSISGITDLAVADGGTGASNAANARTNLGVAIGTDVLAYDAAVQGIADLADPGADRILFWDASAGGYAYLTAGAGITIAGTTVSATSATLADADYGDITVSSSGTVFTIDSDVLSAYGRTLTVAANAAAARSTLGLVIGTDVQGFDLELQALAGTTSAADKIPYYTGPGAATTTDLTSYARTLLDDTDAATARNTLGLGSLATQSNTFTGSSTGTNTGDQMVFNTVSVVGQDDLVADSTSDTLVIKAGTNITITTDKTSDTVTISSSAAGLSDSDYGDITVSGSGTVMTIDADVISTFGRTLVDDANAAAARTTLGLGSLATQNGTFSGTSSGTNTGDQNLFSTIAVSGQSDVVADAATDTLTLVAGSNITITTDAVNDKITIASTAAGLVDGDYGDITVSGSGTVMTIDNDAVTYAKIQNVSATDKILGRSSVGAGDIEEITCTPFARSILDDADEATFKATVNLEIGVDVQAYDAELAALAGLTSAADKVPYFTGAGTASTTDLTAFGRSLIDDADAATARTTLGLVIGTNVQAYDADLTTLSTAFTSATAVVPASLAFAEVTTNGTNTITLTAPTAIATDKVVTFQDVTGTVYVSTGTDVPITDGGTGASDAATARTNLGLAIGTDVQAYDAELAALAGLTSAADALPYFTGAGTASTTTLTAAARSILDDATTAAIATTLGLGTGDSPQFTAVNVGHASDTTITRTGAGDIAVEGNTIYRAGGTDVPVSDGGTGVSSLTAYAVICGGTTGTGAVQSVASVGTSGYVLTSNGPGALPTFQVAAAGGGSIGKMWPVMNGLISA